jgi:hypothetical protein
MPQANSPNHPPTGRLLRAAAAATRMKHAVSRFSLAALGAVALYRAPAAAQEQARAQEIQVYDGELFSDRLTDAPVSGRTPYPIVGYAVPGAGYARAHMDGPIEGEACAQPVSITYGSGATANLGIASKYYVTTNLFWDLGIRSWYLDGVVSLEVTLLTTAGAGTAQALVRPPGELPLPRRPS